MEIPLESEMEANIDETVVVHPGKAIQKDFTFDENQDHLYALTENRYPGAYCKRLGLSCELSFASPAAITADMDSIQKGVVLELLLYGKTQGVSKEIIASSLLDMCNAKEACTLGATRSAMGRLEQKFYKLRGQKRTELLKEKFPFPTSVLAPVSVTEQTRHSPSTSISCSTCATRLDNPSSAPTTPAPAPTTPCLVADSPTASRSQSKKEANFSVYSTDVRVKKARRQLKITLEAKATLVQQMSVLRSRLGHFSPHNVRRREDRAKQRIEALEKENAAVKEQLSCAQVTLQSRDQRVTELEQKVAELEQNLTTRTTSLNLLKSSLRNVRRQLQRAKKTKEQHASAKKEPASAKKEHASAKKEHASAKKEHASAKKQPASAKKQTASVKKGPASAKKQLASAKKQHASTRKEPASELTSSDQWTVT